MKEFTMMMGLPGSGKTHYARAFAASNPNTVVVSSDDIREELWGDAGNQQDPGKVFATMLQRSVELLNAGKSVIYDATNLSARHRKNVLFEVRRQAGECHATLFFVACAVEECKRRQEERERKVPYEVIDRMLRSFQAPWYNEGWDYIAILDGGCKTNSLTIHLEMNDIQHDNSRHLQGESLEDHCYTTLSQVSARSRKLRGIAQEYSTRILMMAAYNHDIGKAVTKTFVDHKGRKTEDAHYYRHENAGAYFWLTSNYIDRWDLKEFLLVGALIQWHMEQYNFDRDGDDEEANKARLTQWAQYRGLGSDFVELLWELHQCDKLAHYVSCYASDNVDD